jgi:histidyl-tRNA synthetase
MWLRTWLFDNLREVSRLMAFEEVDFPVLESEALFVRKAEEEITQQLYGFEDKGGRRVALRPEITPSLARLIIRQVSFPLKWFTIGQCWRYKRMTRGSRREHYQWHMDIFGVPGVRAEAELLQAIVLRFERLGIASSDVGIRLSSRKVLSGHAEYHC